MRIAIDAEMTNRRSPTGEYVYASSLLQAISRIDSKNRYVLYFNTPPLPDWTKGAGNFKISLSPFPRRGWLLWQQIRLPLALLQGRANLFISPLPFLPCYRPCKCIVIAHDIAPLISKDYHTFWQRFRFALVGRFALRQADEIIAVSQSTKNDLVKYLKIDPERITVVYAGFDSDLFRVQIDSNEISELKKKYGIDQEYILFAGTLEPRKNLTRLLDAFALLQKRGWQRHKLVVTGKKGWLYGSIFRKIRELELEREVIFTGYVPRQDLAGLMAGADVFVYPSLYEGFGIPPLEAMACGTPVIVSNTSSFPEVVGDAGIMVNPYDPDQIADAIYRVTSDDEIRKTMRKKGLEQTKKFSWEKGAKECVSLFERASHEE